MFKTISGGFVRMLIGVGFLATAISFHSCKNQDRKPAEILSRDQMVDVLAEIYITEEKVHKLSLPRDSSEMIFRLMEQKVFEKTGVPDSVFEASLDYYIDRPSEFELIYSALVDSLHLKEQRASSRPRSQ